jgi:hypothetical protein
MIYIQSNTERNMPHHFDAACGFYGAQDNCENTRLTTYEEVVSGKFDLLIPNHLFIGSTEFMSAVFARIGLTDVRLPKNSNRESEIITLGEAHERVANGEKIFIKPVEIKLFTGLVLDGFKYSSLEKLPNETKVIAYEPFKSHLQSEWRLYVFDNKIIDSKNYSGDFTLSPSYEYAFKIAGENSSSFPIAYTIDIGILENGENVVVEFNDMWAIGNYGIPNDLYVKLLKHRYFEIINKKS